MYSGMLTCLSCITDPEAYVEAYFGEGQGEIYIENVQCNGSESSLEDCPASEVSVHDCTHSEDAGVRCQSMYANTSFEKSCNCSNKVQCTE